MNTLLALASALWVKLTGTLLATGPGCCPGCPFCS